MKNKIIICIIILLLICFTPIHTETIDHTYVRYKTLISTITTNSLNNETKITIFNTTVIDTIKETVEEVEDNDIEITDITTQIAEYLNCDNDTADSIKQILDSVVKSEITNIRKDITKAHTLFYLTTEDNNEYVALIGKGYTVKKIYKDSIDGECLYNIIE